MRRRVRAVRPQCGSTRSSFIMIVLLRLDFSPRQCGTAHPVAGYHTGALVEDDSVRSCVQGDVVGQTCRIRVSVPMLPGRATGLDSLLALLCDGATLLCVCNEDETMSLLTEQILQLYIVWSAMSHSRISLPTQTRNHFIMFPTECTAVP